LLSLKSFAEPTFYSVELHTLKYVLEDSSFFLLPLLLLDDQTGSVASM